jgi:hypothetical protein
MDKDKGDKANAELRAALLKAQVEGAEGQAKKVKEEAVSARTDFLTHML